MEDQNINVFISSKMRDTNSKPCEFVANFPSGLIQCGETEGININIVSFDILNSFYNVNENNNVLKFAILVESDTDFSSFIEELVIPTGNHSASQLADMITKFSIYIRCDYIKNRNIFKFTKEQNAGQFEIAIIFGNMGEIFGVNQNDIVGVGGSYSEDLLLFLHPELAGTYNIFHEDNSISVMSFESIKQANIMYFNKVIIRVNGVDFERASLENITNDRSSTVFYRSNILLWLSRNDHMPFQMISYNNQDGGNSYCYNVFNKTINSLSFSIENEHGELIEDALDWSMALQFTIYNKKDDLMTKELSIQTSYLREIFVFLNIFYGLLFGRK